jgi:predicted dienelactone hydrolase
MRFGITLLAALFISSSVFAQTSSPSQARADDPELAQRGPDTVGYRQVEIIDPHRVDYLKSNPGKGQIIVGDRHLFVTIWYPAASGAPATIASYDRHPGAGPGSPYADSKQFPQTGNAILNAPPRKGAAPLVIFSHGFTNWATYAAHLCETLASRGYVVASIDHDDIPYKGGNLGLSFLDTSSGRARDQRAVAHQLRTWANDSSFALAGTYDPDNLALMGYSMGGFGALESAGAGYDAKSPIFGMLPKPSFEGLFDTDAKPIPGLKALVLLAPWGGQPANRAWTAEALAAIKIPVLMIDGDHDDVAGYKEGVHWIFDNLKSSDRRLLVFENARHNIVGADAPDSAFGNLSQIQSFDEPVWRKDRIRAIDAHFIVAFLGLTLRNDASMAAYLNPPTPHSSDGTWAQARGQNADSEYAGQDAASANYWKGFQRRWALGLELEHEKP